jgi:polyribonucleotide nucleotidyltransferase
LGHGALAEKAIISMLPSKADFPYTIRVVSEVLSSNGSSSMASTCSSCLALMAAGVPIKEMVAGIAMGVIIDEKNESNYKILTDIQGPEDHYGDMDFKVAGTKNGVNALQLDVKINGIDGTLLRKALTQAKEARLFILEKMKQAIAVPRSEISQYAPKIVSFDVNPEKIGEIIGSGGKTINKIIELTETKIDIEEKTVYITGMDMEKINQAKSIIENLIKEYEIGDIVEGMVSEIKDFGAIVYFDGNNSGLLHISEIDNRRINKVTDVVKLGDKLKLKIIRVENGKISLSLKAMKEDK